jgi:hypothetical protein
MYFSSYPPRGNQRNRMFFDDEDRGRFLDILRKAKERYAYHFSIQP